jgi:hypothetical protein
MNESDRRKMERFSLELPAYLSLVDRKENPKPPELITSNVCSGGAYFKTEKPLTIGIDVKLAVILPLDKFKNEKGKISIIDVSGSVIRTDQQGMAICFDKKYRILPY